MPTDITFASLLTAAGAGIAAGIITALTELLKGVFAGPLTGRAHMVAFGLSALLYVVAGFATSVDTLDEGLVVFLAWLTCATASVGVYATIRTVRSA